MKLQQGQVWQKADDYIRIVHLERLEVKYKILKNMVDRDGTHQHVTKKDFCRLIKDAKLLTEDEVRQASGLYPKCKDSQTDETKF